MFGYVLPDASTLVLRDRAMFQAVFCGLCVAIKKRFGNIARFMTNYDMTVLGVFLIEAVKPEVKFDNTRCIGDPRKKVYVKDSPLMDALANVDILLCYYKGVDDEIDGGGKKKLLRYILKKPYAKAKEQYPEIDSLISERYSALRESEARGESSIDRVADYFAGLLRDVGISLVKRLGGEMTECELNNFGSLCYNIGKFVYIADALDDLIEDSKAKRYNPFLSAYGSVGKGGRQEFIQEHKSKLEFLFASVRNRAYDSFCKMRLTHVGSLLENIVKDGLNAKTKQLLSAKKKLPPPTLKAKKKDSRKAKEDKNERSL